MVAEELINHMIPPLKYTDKAHKAMLWMEELRLKQLPVVDNRGFLGLISEDIILEENSIDKNISEFQLYAKDCVVSSKSHFYNIVKMASDYAVDLVGVIDDEGHYSGVITVQDIIAYFARTAAVQTPGGIMVLSMPQIDYSLSEISRLIEENGAKVLSSAVKNDKADPSQIKLTLKVDRLDLTPLVATLERFGYKINARFQETKVVSDERDRIDLLLKYLDM